MADVSLWNSLWFGGYSGGYGAGGYGAGGYGAGGYGAGGYGAGGYGAGGYVADGYGADGYGADGNGGAEYMLITQSLYVTEPIPVTVEATDVEATLVEEDELICS